MNAYELAEKLKSQQEAKWGRADIWLEPTKLHIDSANMLRQQADRIAELKKRVQIAEELVVKYADVMLAKNELDKQ